MMVWTLNFRVGISSFLNMSQAKNTDSREWLMDKPKLGEGVIVGKNVQFGSNVIVWNYVVIGDNTRIGDGTRIGSFCDIGKNVIIGKNCVVQALVAISNECQLHDNVFIGPNTTVLNDRFPYSGYLTPSIIKSDVVVGGCVTILPNVTVNEKAMIAAGSTVTKDVPAGTVVKGVPARPMMTRPEYEAKREAFLKSQKK
jgi:acetyltransferase-like isoleucine patch superfamily enzyme